MFWLSFSWVVSNRRESTGICQRVFSQANVRRLQFLAASIFKEEKILVFFSIFVKGF